MKVEKTIVILQSNYIPWRGYFDLLNAADVFVFFDEVQYTRRDWRNRNKIVVNGTSNWLTIPVQTKGKYDAAIQDIEVIDGSWARKHWATIKASYAKAPYFSQFSSGLETTYEKAAEETHLSAINRLFLKHLSNVLSIDTSFEDCTSVPRTNEDSTQRLVELCKHFGATRYLSGPSAMSYIVPETFQEAGIELSYADYSGYPEYNQNASPFLQDVSILDPLMMVGTNARLQLKSTHEGGLFVCPDIG